MEKKEQSLLQRESGIAFGYIFALSVFLGSCAGIAALFLGMSAWIGAGVGAGIFLTALFFFDPKLFLAVIIFFRMTLDYFGESFFIPISDTINISVSQSFAIFLFGIGIFFFVRYVRTRVLFVRFFPFWILLAWAMVTLIFSIVPVETVKEIVRFFGIMTLASLGFAYTKTIDDFKRIVFAFLASAVFPIVFGMWQWMMGVYFSKDVFVDIDRIYGTFGHPNVFGLFLVCIIVLAFLSYRTLVQTSQEKFVFLGIGGISFLVLLPTLSRVAWGALLLAFFLLGILRFRMLLGYIVFISLILFLTVAPVQDRVSDIFQGTADSSVLWRGAIWKDGITQALDDGRMWYGFGLDAFPAVITDLHTQEFGSANAHNDIVKFFTEGGILGLSVYLFWMSWFAFSLLRIFLREQRDLHLKEISLFLFVLILSLGAASLSDEIFRSTPIQWVLWISIGSFLGLVDEKKGME